MASKFPSAHIIYYQQQGQGKAAGASNRAREEQSLSGIFSYKENDTNNNNNNNNNNFGNAYPKGMSPQKEVKTGGLATNDRAKQNLYQNVTDIPQAYGAVPSSLRNEPKNRLANEYAKAEHYPFDEKRSLTHATGPAQVPTRRPDNTLFVPKLDPKPARRLHDINEEYLRQIWAEDTKKDVAAERMAKNTLGSPINELRRGGNENPFGRPQQNEDLSSPSSKNSPSSQNNSNNNNNNNVMRNISELQNKTEQAHGCRHFEKMYRTNFVLGPEEVVKVSAGRRKHQQDHPLTTKAVIY